MTGASLRPIPETVRAIEQLGPGAGGGNLLEELHEMGVRVTALVPDCVGLSLVSAEHGVTFTLIATERQLEFLDAMQRWVASTEGEGEARPVPAGDDQCDQCDEEAWRLLGLATAAPCVMSTLTLPMLGDERSAGAVSLYGASRQAFAGHHEHLAEILGAWAPGAVTNADLSFSTLREAEQAPGRLKSASRLTEAARIIAAESDLTLGAARRRIREAADRAGISEAQLAEAVIRLRHL